MVWIKQYGCECAECGTNPCAPGCLCDLDLNEAGGNEGFDQTYDLSSSGFATSADASLEVDWDFDSTVPDRIIVTLDGVTVLDSGCVTGTGSVSISVAAGASSLRIQILAACTAGTTLWSFSAVCVPV